MSVEKYIKDLEQVESRDANRVIAEDISWIYYGEKVQMHRGSERMIWAVADATQYPQARWGESEDESEAGISAARMYQHVFKMPFYKVSAYYLYHHNVCIVLTHHNSILTKYVPTFLGILDRLV